MAHSHVMIGVAGYTTLVSMSHGTLPLDPLTISVAALGSLAPDLDHPRSWLGGRLFFISLPLSALCGHRGITHSLMAALTTTVTLWWYIASSSNLPWLSAFLLGYMLHLFADWNTNSGIPLLWPNMKRFRAPWAINTGGFFEHLFATSFGCYLTWIGWNLFVSGEWRQFI